MPASEPPSDEKRSAERVEVEWAVDCETEDTFLYASITNISEMGIFVRTDAPLAVGTELTLSFSPRGDEPTFTMVGRVQWVNQIHTFGENLNPGMGVKFVSLSLEQRERLVATIHTIAYLRNDPTRYNEN
ncbi:MAG: TIGR02266 family protein [Deltaproteobacteria bacterium]|nr:TIGR02266 family protein [Deltaproteobacteria bacterium]